MSLCLKDLLNAYSCISTCYLCRNLKQQYVFGQQAPEKESFSDDLVIILLNIHTKLEPSITSLKPHNQKIIPIFIDR